MGTYKDASAAPLWPARRTSPFCVWIAPCRHDQAMGANIQKVFKNVNYNKS